MKATHLFIFLILTSISSLGQNPSSTQNKKYDLTLKKLNVTETIKGSVLKIAATLTNYSTDTLFYFSMSCSWQEFYVIDNKQLKININPCDKNVSTVIFIAPNKSHTLELEISSLTKFMQNETSFKIGLELLKAKNRFDHNDSIKHNQKQEILWSEKLNFK